MIADTLSSIITNLSNAYDMAQTKGATIPQSRNFENLASTIGTIQTGGGRDYLADYMNGTIVNLSNDNIGTAMSFSNNSNLMTVNLPNCYNVRSNTFNACNRLYSINLPNLISMGDVVFGYCSQLQSVSFENLISIGGNVFNNCENLREIYMPNIYSCSQNFLGSNCNQITSINVFNVTSVVGAWLNGKSLVTHISLPFIRPFSGNVFLNCSALKSVITRAGSTRSVFTNCISLESIYIVNKSIATLGTSEFVNTPITDSTLLGYYGSVYVMSERLESYKSATNWVSISDRITALPSEFSSKYVYEYEYSYSRLPEFPSEKLNCEYILNNAFVSNGYMSSILSLSNCKVIGGSAFSGCYSLTTINLPNCEYIHPGAFAGCNSIKTINLPNCRVILSANFRSISASSITLPKCIYLGYNCFDRATFIREIDLPECRIIDGNAFSSCYRLSSISIPNVRRIGEYAFYSCLALSKLELPQCQYIMYSAFYNCSNLSQVILESQCMCSVNTTTTTVFGNTPITDSTLLGYYGSVYVPDSLVSEYKVAQHWSDIADRITGISNLPSE